MAFYWLNSSSNTLVGTNRADEIHGGGGADQLAGSGGSDTISSGIDNVQDRLYGDESPFGEMKGRSGNDVLHLGPRDIAWGGVHGKDVYVIHDVSQEYEDYARVDRFDFNDKLVLGNAERSDVSIFDINPGARIVHRDGSVDLRIVAMELRTTDDGTPAPDGGIHAFIRFTEPGQEFHIQYDGSWEDKRAALHDMIDGFLL